MNQKSNIITTKNGKNATTNLTREKINVKVSGCKTFVRLFCCWALCQGMKTTHVQKFLFDVSFLNLYLPVSNELLLVAA